MKIGGACHPVISQCPFKIGMVSEMKSWDGGNISGWNAFTVYTADVYPMTGQCFKEEMIKLKCFYSEHGPDIKSIHSQEIFADKKAPRSLSSIRIFHSL